MRQGVVGGLASMIFAGIVHLDLDWDRRVGKAAGGVDEVRREAFWGSGVSTLVGLS